MLFNGLYNVAKDILEVYYQFAWYRNINWQTPFAQEPFVKILYKILNGPIPLSHGIGWLIESLYTEFVRWNRGFQVDNDVLIGFRRWVEGLYIAITGDNRLTEPVAHNNALILPEIIFNSADNRLREGLGLPPSKNSISDLSR